MRIWLVLLCLGLSSSLFAQIDETIILPKGFAPGELERMPEYIAALQHKKAACINDPGDTDLRSMAEWEELQAIVISWINFRAILTEIVRHAKEEVEVIIVCFNEDQVKAELEQAGVDWTTNVTFIEESFNTIWVRDYGPNTVYKNGVGDLAFVDWI